MQFIDRAAVEVKAGDGGDGMVAFRREKFVPAGGPSGGNGGRGGSVVFVADSNLQTLLDFQFKRLYKAEDGAKGGSSNKTGRSGKDCIVRVPCGTVVYEAGSEAFIGDLVSAEQTLTVAQGGFGGLGNTRFLSNRNRAPEQMTEGKPGEQRRLLLELKLIAEVGIVGLPNAGKSTLISVLSSARPKIADYPFTTLVPNLGVVRRPLGDGVVFADIPGLIEGAHEGTGLGYEFLRHVERTRILLHLIDGSQDDPVGAYRTIQAELEDYGHGLADKPQIVALNKIDAIAPDELDFCKTELERAIGQPVSAISAVAQLELAPLTTKIFDLLDRLNAEAELADASKPEAYRTRVEAANVMSERS